MKVTIDRIQLALMYAMIIFGMGCILFGISRDYEHNAYLQQHGCVLTYSADTGYYIAGKVQKHEVVKVYDCADGRHAELD